MITYFIPAAVVGKTEPPSGQIFPTEPKKVNGLAVTPLKVHSTNSASDSEMKKSPTVMTSATLSMVPTEALLQVAVVSLCLS